ncbi:hypothetical protein ACWGI8_20060 [Streptomyces sp. NPDC054841]
MEILTELAGLSLVGGLLGASLEVLTVPGVAHSRERTGVISTLTVAAAPAIRTARIQPVEGLRH